MNQLDASLLDLIRQCYTGGFCATTARGALLMACRFYRQHGFTFTY